MQFWISKLGIGIEVNPSSNFFIGTFDRYDKPNGTPRKLLDVSKATNLGWTYKTELEDGIRLAYEDFLNNPMRAER